jgi:Group II intron, maturase-specific domain
LAKIQLSHRGSNTGDHRSIWKFRARKAWGGGRRAFAGFLPAASPKALTSINQTIRRWTLHHRSDKALQELAKMYNPYIQGWINYYGKFYRMQLRPTLQRISSASAAARWRALLAILETAQPKL